MSWLKKLKTAYLAGMKAKDLFLIFFEVAGKKAVAAMYSVAATALFMGFAKENYLKMRFDRRKKLLF